MGLFRRKNRTPPLARNTDPFSEDLSVTLRRAQELLANTDAASDGNHHWMPIGDDSRGRLNEALAQAEAAIGSGQKFTGPGGATGSGFGGSGTAADWAKAFEASGSQDPITKLERLTRLRDTGALTPDEFEQQKRKVLEEG